MSSTPLPRLSDDDRVRAHRPAAGDLAARVPIALTPREGRILAAVALHGFLTVGQIEVAFFPPLGAERRSHCAHAYERVRQLWLHGYLDRYELPRPFGATGGRPSLFALGLCGRRHLLALGYRSGDARIHERPERRKAMFLPHNLHAASFWAILQPLVPSGRLADVRWLPERDLRRRHMRVPDQDGGRPLTVLPDGYMELAYPDGRLQCAMIEVDMATEDLERFGKKLRAWETFQAGGLFTRHFGRASCEVLVLSWGRKRSEAVWDLGRTLVPQASWRWYSFATLDALDPRRVGRAVWRTLADTTTPLLYRPNPLESAGGC